jgi:hypothetical protein
LTGTEGNTMSPIQSSIEDTFTNFLSEQIEQSRATAFVCTRNSGLYGTNKRILGFFSFRQ